jgi:hypothetical protein
MGNVSYCFRNEICFDFEDRIVINEEDVEFKLRNKDKKDYRKIIFIQSWWRGHFTRKTTKITFQTENTYNASSYAKGEKIKRVKGPVAGKRGKRKSKECTLFLLTY